MKRRNKRFRLFADTRMQTALCGRIAIYWLVCQGTVLSVIYAMLAFEASNGGAPTGSPWRFLVPAFVVSSIALPLVLLDQLMFSNKFAGPLLRFRRHLQSLNNDEETGRLRFRTGDHYMDLCDEFNRFHDKTLENNRETHKPETDNRVSEAPATDCAEEREPVASA